MPHHLSMSSRHSPKLIESLFNIFMLKIFGMTIDVDKKGNNQIKFVDSNNHNSDLVVFKRKCPRGVACSTAQNYEENKKKVLSTFDILHAIGLSIPKCAYMRISSRAM